MPSDQVASTTATVVSDTALHADPSTLKRVTNSLDPLMPDLTWPMLQVQSAMQSLERVEQQLRSGTLDEGAAALKLVTYSAAELKACYAFIDQLEQSVHSAGLLVEATERRLEVLEGGERLPEEIANLPPPMFTNHQFTRQIRRREHVAPPDLPELNLLPRSRSTSATSANLLRVATGGGGVSGMGRRTASFTDSFSAATVELFNEANSSNAPPTSVGNSLGGSSCSSNSTAVGGGGGGAAGRGYVSSPAGGVAASTSDLFGDAYGSGFNAAAADREEMERDLAELKLKVSVAAAKAKETARSRAQELVGGLRSWWGS